MKKNFISRLVIFFPLIFFVLLVCVAVPPRLDETAESSPWQTEAQSIGLPAFSLDDQIIIHAAYTLKYNEKYEQAEWVAYKLVYSELKNIKRAGKFRIDPAVKTGSDAPEDYSNQVMIKGISLLQLI